MVRRFGLVLLLIGAFLVMPASMALAQRPAGMRSVICLLRCGSSRSALVLSVCM